MNNNINIEGSSIVFNDLIDYSEIVSQSGTFTNYVLVFDTDYYHITKLYLNKAIWYFYTVNSIIKKNDDTFNYLMSILFRIVNVLDGNVTNEKLNIEDFSKMPLFEIYKKFKVSPSNSKEHIDLSYDYWTKFYWIFLHYMSICVDVHEITKQLFASFLMQFDQLIPCHNCSHNYKAKQPHKYLFCPIYSGQNCTTAIYNLHNMVNKALYKKQFTIEEFCDRFDAKLIKTERLKIKDECWSECNKLSV